MLVEWCRNVRYGTSCMRMSVNVCVRICCLYKVMLGDGSKHSGYHLEGVSRVAKQSEGAGGGCAYHSFVVYSCQL